MKFETKYNKFLSHALYLIVLFVSDIRFVGYVPLYVLCAIMWLFISVLGKVLIPYMLSERSWQWGHSMMMPDSGSHLVVEMNCILYIVSGFRLRRVGRLRPILLVLSCISLAPSWTQYSSRRDCWQGLVAICAARCLAPLWYSGQRQCLMISPGLKSAVTVGVAIFC